MQVEKYCWKRPKSVELCGTLCTPDGSMAALIIMVHGVGQHSGCYSEWAERFAMQSIGFLTFDLRGHGHSAGVRGHTSINAIKDDLRAIIKSMQQKFPGVPVVLFGHSMGGQVVLSYAVDRNVKVQGIIASSPWLKLVRPPSYALIGLAKCVSYIVPQLTIRTGIKAGQLSQNGAGTGSTKKDPLLHKKISIGLFTDLWKNGEIILRNKHRLNTPLLLMHGTADPLTSYRASKAFAQNAGEYTTFKQWHGMRHDLFNDTGNEVVFQYVVKWLSKQIIENGTVQNSRKMYRIA